MCTASASTAFVSPDPLKLSGSGRVGSSYDGVYSLMNLLVVSSGV
jgi:hypothetical protein